MARLSIKVRDRKRRKLEEKYREKRLELKKAGDQKALDKLPRDASPVRLHNRCAITGRGKGYIRDFKICRNVFREMASNGKIPGVTKSSW